MQPTITILTGGVSSEREVALQSADFVEAELTPHFACERYDFPNDLERFLQNRQSIQLTIPLFHGVGGEDGTIQGFLKTLGIPFLFSDVEAQAIAMNKAITKDLFLQHSIPTAPYTVFTRNDPFPAYQAPCVIKPLDSGSSIGVAIAESKAAFSKGIEDGFKWSSRLMIERYLEGREFTVAVIEESKCAVSLPVIEIKSKHSFFDLESKYDPTLVEEICPARMDEDLARTLRDLAIKTHTIIGAKHLSRTDFIVDTHGTPWVLEINTIPGQTQHSLLPKAVRSSGRNLGTIYRAWIEEALRIRQSGGY